VLHRCCDAPRTSPLSYIDAIGDLSPRASLLVSWFRSSLDFDIERLANFET